MSSIEGDSGHATTFRGDCPYCMLVLYGRGVSFLCHKSRVIGHASSRIVDGDGVGTLPYSSCLVSSLGSGMYRIELTPEALEDLASLRNFDLRRVVDEIEVQLKDEPTRETRKRKRLRPNQLAEWELRVESFRVFYSTNDHNLRSLRKFWNPFSHAALSSCSVSACRAASNAVTLLRPTTVTW